MEDQNDAAIQQKHQAMIERLSNRHQSRVREKEETDSSPSFESTDSFLVRFTELKQSINSELVRIDEALESFTKKIDLDRVSISISELEQLLAENSYHLPSYEVRASLKTISDLKQSLEDASSKLVPRKKFSFKSKAAKQRQPVAVVQEVEVDKCNTVSLEETRIAVDTPGFRNREGEVLVENQKGKDMREFSLLDHGSWEVRLLGRSRAIFIHRLRKCKIYAGPALGSVLLDDVEGCVFVLASHQIRIHNAKECDFYLRVRSRPIVEDSNGLGIAPYCLKYEGIEDDLKESRLDEETGNWAMSMILSGCEICSLLIGLFFQKPKG